MSAQATQADDGTDDSSTTDYREKVANGNRIQLWGQGYDSAARRLAGRLPRDMDGLRFVEAGCGEGAIMWLDVPDEPLRKTEVPDGYELVCVDHFESGDLALTVSPTN